MSSASASSRRLHDRVNSLQRDGRTVSRNDSRSRPKIVTSNEAYTYSLRVAYLSYLLQPRQKRLQHVAVSPQSPQRSSTSINDLMRDFSLVRDSKSTRFPHGFLAELEKRLTNVLMGKERGQEYNDALVKRTFAVFYTAFMEQGFRRRMEKDRRVEDLVLIFFSSATKELQKGKAPSDDGWKLMVDRHVALFVRLLSSILRDNDWARDRPELASRLATLESKLLLHDNDLVAASQRAGGAGGSTVEVEVPLSYEAKDMPLVLVVARVYGISYAQVQADITKNRPIWTAKAALMDLKTYQNLLSLNSKRTLRSEDFDVEEAYEAWKKAEGPALSQMMLAIIQSNPELAKTSSAATLPYFSPNDSVASDSGFSEISRKMSDLSSDHGSYVIDQPVDVSELNLNDDSVNQMDEGSNPFTYIPPDPRAYYRAVLMQALTYDLTDHELQASESTADTSPRKVLSHQSAELLNEISIRWRIPYFSRMVLLLDVIKQKFLDQEISLETLDAAFDFIKEPSEKSNASVSKSDILLLSDRSMWTIADFALNRQILSSLYEALLRDLYDALQHCYESKPPSIGPIMYVLENHICNDPLFSMSPDDGDRFTAQLTEGLQRKALDTYSEYLHKEIPQTQDEWQFYHVIQLGKAIMKLADRVQKRYKKNPKIMG